MSMFAPTTRQPLLRDRGAGTDVAACGAWTDVAACGAAGQRGAACADPGCDRHVCDIFQPVACRLMGNQPSHPIAGTGHQSSPLREAVVTVLLTGGSLATVAAVAMVLWGLCAWKN